jgi:hypothetical protein
VAQLCPKLPVTLNNYLAVTASLLPLGWDLIDGSTRPREDGQAFSASDSIAAIMDVGCRMNSTTRQLIEAARSSSI